jgi:cyclopropane fatty-acyl-phospholipid synthase-like methyltransferase
MQFTSARAIGLSVKQHAPAADRNKGPIASVLRRVLPDFGIVLEIGSGTGQHVAHFARELPGVVWQPSDYDQVAVASIDSYRRELSQTNLREPLLLEVRKRTWGHGLLDGVVAINLVHVTSWSVCEGLFDGSRRHLRPHGVLFLYGPFKQNGGFTSRENAELDAALRARNPDWGLRDIEAVSALGAVRGLNAEQVIDMPGGDLGVVFRKQADN